MTELLTTKIDNIQQSFSVMKPEICILITFLSLIIVACTPKAKNSNISLGIVLTGIIASIYTSIISQKNTTSIFIDTLILTPYSQSIRILLAAIVGTNMVFFENSKFATSNKIPKSFLYAIVTSIWLGASLLSISSHIMTMFISLELLSIPSYILVALPGTKNTTKASVQYILFGMTATALMVYGMSIVYGLTGTFYILDPEFGARLWLSNPYIIALGLFLMLSGLFFKLALAPFHYWILGVYQATSLPIISFFSTIGTVAGFAFLAIFIKGLGLELQLASLKISVSEIICIIAAVTMILGAVGGLMQNKFKSVLAYSTIGNAGFLSLLFVNTQFINQTYLLVYLTVYVFGTILALFIGYLLDLESDDLLLKCSGLFKKNTFLAIVLLLSMLSLAGLPPTAGFMAKFLVLSDIWSVVQGSGNKIMIATLFVALGTTVISLFYYLKVIFYSFFRSPLLNSDEIKVTSIQKLITILLAIPLIIFFLKIDWLIALFS